MKKLILLLILLPTLCFAGLQEKQCAVIAKKNAVTGFCSAGCSGTTLFCWVPDSVTPDCTQGGDTTAALTGEANLTSGVMTLVDDTDDGADYYTLDITSFDTFPDGAFTIEMTINFSVITANMELIKVTVPNGVGGNGLAIQIVSTNDVKITHQGAGVVEANTFNTNLSTNTDYQLVMTADTATGMDVSIDGGANWIGVPASSTITTMDGTGTGTIDIGNKLGYNTEGTITNVRIKSGYKTGY